MDWGKIQEKLREPFRPDEIEWRVGSTNKEKTKGLALAYVTNRAIQDRLDEVFGPAGWQNEFRLWKDNSQICGIGVWDDDKNQWIWKWDGADDTNLDAIKGGLSDAMKRAAYQWGIGRYLYKIPQTWCDIEQYGSSYRLKEIPELPEWALPKGYTPNNSKVTPINRPKQNEASPGTNIQCQDCNKPIGTTPEQTERVIKWCKSHAVQYQNKVLCPACQKKYPARKAQ